MPENGTKVLYLTVHLLAIVRSAPPPSSRLPTHWLRSFFSLFWMNNESQDLCMKIFLRLFRTASRDSSNFFNLPIASYIISSFCFRLLNVLWSCSYLLYTFSSSTSTGKSQLPLRASATIWKYLVFEPCKAICAFVAITSQRCKTVSVADNRVNLPRLFLFFAFGVTLQLTFVIMQCILLGIGWDTVSGIGVAVYTAVSREAAGVLTCVGVAVRVAMDVM